MANLSGGILARQLMLKYVGNLTVLFVNSAVIFVIVSGYNKDPSGPVKLSLMPLVCCHTVHCSVHVLMVLMLNNGNRQILHMVFCKVVV